MAEKKETKERYELTEIATATSPAFRDNKNGDVINVETLLLRIANDLEDIKKGL